MLTSILLVEELENRTAPSVAGLLMPLFGAGSVSVPATLNSWAEFTNTSSAPTFDFRSGTGADIVPWIGRSGATQSQKLESANLIPGTIYEIDIYPAF